MNFMPGGSTRLFGLGTDGDQGDIFVDSSPTDAFQYR